MSRTMALSMLRSVRVAPLLLAFFCLVGSARAQSLYSIERVETQGDLVRVYAVAGLGPVEAVVRQNANEALRRAAPQLMGPRDVGTHRFREPQLDVRSVRFAPGHGSQEVRIDVEADVTAERDHRTFAWDGLLPSFRWVPDGRHRIANGRLVVRVGVGIQNGNAVVLRILGERLVLSDPLDLDLDLEGRVLHTQVVPIPPHPSTTGLTPEAAALRGIDGERMRFVVRFRRS